METNELRIGWQRGAIDLPTRNRGQADEHENLLANLRVCLISSNSFACNTIKQMLQSVGMSGGTEYRSFKDAGQGVRERKFDLMIIDSGGDDAATMDFIGYVRASMDDTLSCIPIIAVVDGTDLDQIRKVRDHGVNAILLRPFSAKGLMARVGKVLNRSASFIRSGRYIGPCRRAPRRELKSAGEERRAA